MAMTYDEALAYIHSVDWKGSRPGLSRITELCSLMGNPEDSLKFIHIAGTNGKGSVSKMLSCILEEAGYRTGLFTSPYIERFNERIMLDGEPISDEDLAEVTEYTKQFADQMEDKPTEFELNTAIGLEYYKRKKCDYVVFECGMGGRLDSTNVINTSVISIITGIDIDHSALLGDTTAKIAFEKAGIIKPGVPVLAGEVDKDADEVIRREAEKKGSDYHRTVFSAHDITSNLSGTSFVYGERNVHINLHGMYQVRNASTVITAVEILRSRGTEIGEDALLRGLAKAEWKARFEILRASSPLIIYDGAHNPQGIAGAVENIGHYLSPLSENGKVALLMGVMADKEHRKMIEMLSPLVSHAFTVTPSNARSLPSSGVCEEFASFGVKADFYDTIDDGVRAAADYARLNDIPLICLGSLYMYADVKAAVNRL